MQSISAKYYVINVDNLFPIVGDSDEEFQNIFSSDYGRRNKQNIKRILEITR